MLSITTDMKNIKKYVFTISALLLILLQRVSLCSCDLDESRNNFRGGELLDAERMSEIKNEVLGTEALTGSNETTADKSTESTTDNDTDNETAANAEESSNGTQKDTEGTERNETETSKNADGTAIFVYWLKGGTRWHLSADCYHIRNKEVISGTEEDAIEAGMKSVCSSCSRSSD